MNKSDLKRNRFKLSSGPLSIRGYDKWWHFFTGYNHNTGETKTFFVEYFVINPQKGKSMQVPVFGQTPNGNIPSYVMVRGGTFGNDAVQLNRYFPIVDMNIGPGNLELKVGNCFLSETKIQGEVQLSPRDIKNHPEYMSNSGHMSWDLEVYKKIAFSVGRIANNLSSYFSVLELFWHVEGLLTEFKGTVTFNDQLYDVLPQKCYGYSDKTWGKDFTSPWVWLTSANLTSEIDGRELSNSALGVIGGEPRFAGLHFPYNLLLQLSLEGKDYEFLFSHRVDKAKTTFECHESEKSVYWNIITENRGYVMEVFCICLKADMLLINYEAPNGKKLHNHLWCGGTGTGTIKLYKKSRHGIKVLTESLIMNNVGCEYGEYDNKKASS